MADADDKTQKLIDKAVKTAKKDQLKLITDAVKDAKTAAAELEDKGHKKAVSDSLKTLGAAIKEAVAE